MQNCSLSFDGRILQHFFVHKSSHEPSSNKNSPITSSNLVPNNDLTPVTQSTYNNLNGKAPTTLGEIHFELQKRPIGATSLDFLANGTQEFGIKDALVLCGIFQDESADG